VCAPPLRVPKKTRGGFFGVAQTLAAIYKLYKSASSSQRELERVYTRGAILALESNWLDVEIC
jgi:hypothetical protein